jgi:hypothetical protein
MSDLIQRNPYLLIVVFTAVCLVFIIVFVAYRTNTKNRKTKIMSGSSDLAELVFDYPVISPSPLGKVVGNPASSVYVLYTVSGEPPQVFGKSVLVSPGDVTLVYEFFLRQVGHRHFAKPFGKSECTFVVSAGRRYRVEFDNMENTLMVKSMDSAMRQ